MASGVGWVALAAVGGRAGGGTGVIRGGVIKVTRYVTSTLGRNFPSEPRALAATACGPRKRRGSSSVRLLSSP